MVLDSGSFISVTSLEESSSTRDCIVSRPAPLSRAQKQCFANYCPNCGAIASTSHTKTERLEGEPVCTDCAVTERFTVKTKYFYHEDNLKTFREEYAVIPIHEKTMENKL